MDDCVWIPPKVHAWKTDTIAVSAFTGLRTVLATGLFCTCFTTIKVLLIIILHQQKPGADPGGGAFNRPRLRGSHEQSIRRSVRIAVQD